MEKEKKNSTANTQKQPKIQSLELSLSTAKGLAKKANRLIAEVGDSGELCKKHIAIAPVKHTKVPMIFVLLYWQLTSNHSSLHDHSKNKVFKYVNKWCGCFLILFVEFSEENKFSRS